MAEFENREIYFYGTNDVWVTYLDGDIIHSTKLADGPEWEDNPYNRLYDELHAASKVIGKNMNQTIDLLRNTETKIKYSYPIKKS